MSRVDRLASVVTDHSTAVVVGLLVVTLLLGAGATGVSQSSSLDQFQSDSEEARALSYVQSNFSTGPENTTTVQIIVRGENVLSRDALLSQLRFERALLENGTVNATLSANATPTGVANLVATALVRQGQAGQLRQQGRELAAERARLNRSVAALADALNETRAIQRQYDRVNRSYEAGELNESSYQARAETLQARLAGVRQGATANLTANQTETFLQLYGQTRRLQGQLDALNASYAAGQINRSTYESRAAEIRAGFQEVYRGLQGVYAEEYRALGERAEALEANRTALQGESLPPLSAQIDALEGANESQVDAVLRTLLGDGPSAGGPGGNATGNGTGGNGTAGNATTNGTGGGAGAGGGGGGGAPGGSRAFALMPTSYEPGSTTAEATMIVLTQTTESETAQGSASERITESQLAIEDVATDRLGEDTLVFGAGIINDEITRSMTDSLAIVGPLALLFVLVVLVVAYRDLVDIVLGLLGILLVLVWTFGFMGWLGIAFNQIMIAVPVLLIGLSIDYAIHVFMRHREERARTDVDGGIPGAMRAALSSVGVALVVVTATTVIGFLSNLISSVPPIRDFGVASAFGIVAALVIFGAFVPAVKVLIDSFLERRGLDRRKSAFGTGGGALGRALAGGVTAARRAPWVVIGLALLVSAGGVYGATQVDTSFAQEDFLAEDPSGWTESLPEPFAPGEYTAKSALSYVNDNFLRQDSSAAILVRGNVTDPAVLDRLDRAQANATESNVTVVLSSGEANVRSPLTVMERVAARNASFRSTFAAADTDGDGVPDRDLREVYDALYAVAPDEARGVIHRTEGGDYRALRLTVSLKGGAASGEVTEEMRDVAAIVAGGPDDGIRATATGQPIVFELVQDQLLQTVIESLLITLVAVFAFLMVTYRISDGSATLGFVTLLPVVLSVTWILGTMSLLGIPFNVLTGMITSLTVGLGVAYSIHISERYAHELERQGVVWGAMRRTLTGTGGALLGSAATTVGGFGVLAFAILPPLRQFGIITGLTIVYAFVASVLVLPSLLAVWTEWFEPTGGFEFGEGAGRRGEAGPAHSDGGRD